MKRYGPLLPICVIMLGELLLVDHYPTLNLALAHLPLLAIALYTLTIGRSLRIARNAKDWLGSFMVIGLITIFITHVVFNIGMNLRIFPVTGLPLPLPFLSYGGLFLLTNVILFALIINVGMRKYFFD